MSTRSPHNDRYKVDQKGQTRRSASSAKPKRGPADLTPADAPKKKAAPKKTWWGRGPATTPMPVVAATPEMKKLRMIWWGLWGTSLAIAVVILLIQNTAKQAGDAAALVAQAVSGATTVTVAAAAAAASAPYNAYVPFAWGLWAAAMGGAFYLEFSPIRKARMAAMDAARKGGKPVKSDGEKKSAKTAGDAPEPGDK